MIKKALKYFEAFLEIVCPLFCAICYTPYETICTECINLLSDEISPLIFRHKNLNINTLSSGKYDGVWRKSILQFKDHHRQDLLAIIEASIRLTVHKKLEFFKADDNNSNRQKLLFIPVPSSHKSIKKRGFNQACTISQILVKTFNDLGFNAEICDILKQNGSVKQVEQTAFSRLDAKAGLIKVKPNQLMKFDFNNSKIILVDDIITTGACLNECLRVLTKHQIIVDKNFVLANAV